MIITERGSGPGQRLLVLDGREVLLFGRAGCAFSNFSPSPIKWRCPICGEEQHAATVEHGFQAAKAVRCEDAHRIVGAVSARAARTAGRRVELRDDWDEGRAEIAGRPVSVKAAVMWDLLGEKFADLEASARLQATEDLILVEDAPWDGFWGAGKDGKGRNVLGRLLMALRDQQRGVAVEIPSPTPAVPR